jgi:hypothetical protein
MHKHCGETKDVVKEESIVMLFNMLLSLGEEAVPL